MCSAPLSLGKGMVKMSFELQIISLIQRIKVFSEEVELLERPLADRN